MLVSGGFAAMESVFWEDTAGLKCGFGGIIAFSDVVFLLLCVFFWDVGGRFNRVSSSLFTFCVFIVPWSEVFSTGKGFIRDALWIYDMRSSKYLFSWSLPRVVDVFSCVMSHVQSADCLVLDT